LEAALDRGDLSNEEWSIIGMLLPSERGRKARPAHDNRRFLSGMLHVLRVGCTFTSHWHQARAIGIKRGEFFCRLIEREYTKHI
jgi:transposase